VALCHRSRPPGTISPILSSVPGCGFMGRIRMTELWLLPRQSD
jgi:hypothetical protein